MDCTSDYLQRLDQYQTFMVMEKGWAKRPSLPIVRT